MKKHNFVKREWLGLVVISLLSACAQAPVKNDFASGQETPSGKAIFYSEDRHVTVPFVDGQKTTSALQMFWSGTWVKKGELTPEAGHRYALKSAVYTTGQHEAARIWIHDVVSYQTVGQLLFGENEPVVPETGRMEQSVLFKWSPPQGEHWVILYRNNQETVLGKSGKAMNESYVLQATTFVLPAMKSEAEFLEHVKKGILSEPNDGRYKNREDTA